MLPIHRPLPPLRRTHRRHNQDTHLMHKQREYNIIAIIAQASALAVPSSPAEPPWEATHSLRSESATSEQSLVLTLPWSTPQSTLRLAARPRSPPLSMNLLSPPQCALRKGWRSGSALHCPRCLSGLIPQAGCGRQCYDGRKRDFGVRNGGWDFGARVAWNLGGSGKGKWGETVVRVWGS